MAEVEYKNVCLVCSKVIAPEDITEHLVQNYGHALVECMVRGDDVVSQIDINASIIGRTTTWGDICHDIYTAAVDADQKNRLVQVVNAGFITALKTRNFVLAKGIAYSFLNAGAITQADYDLVVAQIPDVED